MNLGLRGKFALVTGGSHGIGRSTALALAAEGCNVAICARSEEKLKTTVAEIESKGGKALGIRADVLIPGDIELVVKAVIEAWGSLHILVNNAGGGGRWGNEQVTETAEQVWVDVYNKNALAAVRFTMKVIPYMRKQKWGRVVTVTSIYSREGGGRPWFSMAKCAETALMKGLALRQELVRDGLTFNSVAPGAIMIPDTGWAKEKNDHPQAFEENLKNNFPLGRLGTPEEVANVIAFICSEKAVLINGASISVDGGESRSF